MPSSEIMHDWKAGTLHSGKGGPIVKSRRQAIAIKMSYERKEGVAGHLNKLKAKGLLKPKS